MFNRTIIASLIGAAALSVSARADQLKATVVSYDPVKSLITLDDRSQIAVDPKKIEGKVEPGVIIVLDWTGTENGYDPINFVRVLGLDGKRPSLN
jgi:hypothetical protein